MKHKKNIQEIFSNQELKEIQALFSDKNLKKLQEVEKLGNRLKTMLEGSVAAEKEKRFPPKENKLGVNTPIRKSVEKSAPKRISQTMGGTLSIDQASSQRESNKNTKQTTFEPSNTNELALDVRGKGSIAAVVIVMMGLLFVFPVILCWIKQIFSGLGTKLAVKGHPVKHNINSSLNNEKMQEGKDKKPGKKNKKKKSKNKHKDNNINIINLPKIDNQPEQPIVNNKEPSQVPQSGIEHVNNGGSNKKEKQEEKKPPQELSVWNDSNKTQEIEKKKIEEKEIENTANAFSRMNKEDKRDKIYNMLEIDDLCKLLKDIKELTNFKKDNPDYVCPVSFKIMRNPCIISGIDTKDREINDGAYETLFIKNWLEAGNNISPGSGVEIKSYRLIENKSLKDATKDALRNKVEENEKRCDFLKILGDERLKTLGIYEHFAINPKNELKPKNKVKPT